MNKSTQKSTSNYNRMNKQPSVNYHKIVKATLQKQETMKIVENQETARTELVQEIKDFEFSDIFTCKDIICKIDEVKKSQCNKPRNIKKYMK